MEHERNQGLTAGSQCSTYVLDQRTDDLLQNHRSERRCDKKIHRLILPVFFLGKLRENQQAVEDDRLLLTEIERRMKDSRSLSDQEEILQILQKHISTKYEFQANS